jgi:Tol biopolymer transport system component
MMSLIATGACTTAVALPLMAGAATQTHPGGRASGSIAFMRPGEIGQYDVWVVRPDGSGLRRLTQAPLNRSDYNSDWSPEGSRVLFERRVLEDGDDGDDLYTVEADGTGLRRLTDCHGDCWADNEGAWSADGRRIAFDSATGPRAVGHPSKVAIAVMRADGTRIRELSTPEAGEEDHYPTWSPDGATVVFMRNFADDPQTPTKLMAVDVASGAERVVYRFPEWAPGAGDPKFSPSGKRILFTYWCTIAVGDECPASTRSARNARLATIRPDGTGLRLLHLGTLADSPTWSPDGRRIAFRCQPQLGTIRLCTSRLDGRDLTMFPYSPLLSVHPDWGMQP